MHAGAHGCFARSQVWIQGGGATLPLSAHQCLPWPAIMPQRPRKWRPAWTLHCEGPERLRHPRFCPSPPQLLIISLVHYPIYELARHASTPTMPSVLHTIRRMTRDDVHSTRRAERAVSKRHGWIAPPLPADSPDEHPDEAYSFFGTPRIASSCRCEQCWATPLAQCPATIAATVRDRKVSLPSFLRTSWALWIGS